MTAGAARTKPTAPARDAALLARLRAAIAPDLIVDDPAERAYFANDVAGPGPVGPAFVARPASVADVAAIVRTAREMGCPIAARGGGMSYTGGYQLERPDGVLIDMRAMSAVESIADEDGYVIVQAGCTWAALYEALAARGLRTPFFGPLSGFVATVGGALSQHAAFFGSAEYGASTDSVLGLEVVLASGEVLRTGAWAREDGAPFLRAWGPDLTGLFLGDCGAFGVKTRVALRVAPAPRTGFASFAAADMDALLDAQCAMAGLRGLADCFAFDPVANDNLKRTGFTIGEKAGAAADVARAAGGGLRGLAAAAKLGARRTAFLGDVRYSLHLAVDGASDAEVERTLSAARAIAARVGLREIADSVPRATRARPFRPIKALLGPDGERWLPVHGLAPLSKAREAAAAVDRTLRGAEPAMAERGVRVGVLTALVGRAFLIEPQFFWRDALTPFHLRHVTDAQREKYADRAADLPARALVVDLRAQLAAALDGVGATHFQIGRYYALRDVLSAPARQALDDVKAALDPTSTMNPGVLGFESAPPDRSH